MYTAADYELKDDEASRAARARVKAYIKVGAQEQERLVQYCAMNIPRDRYVPPSKMFFRPALREKEGTTEEVKHAKLLINYIRDSGQEKMSIHRHALGQLCDYATMPRQYAGKLDEPSDKAWRRTLLADNLNTLFEHQKFTNRLKKPAEFLHRIVNNELRAVLTQSYNRHLLSATMLQPFLAAIRSVGVEPAKATVTDMRVHLQCYLPYVFEPIPGEYIAMGTSWSNSDFGQGKLKISHTVLRLNGMGNLVTDDAFSRMHLGSVVEDTDLVLDEVVAKKELETVAAATMSAVHEVMKPEQVKKVLDAITAASLEKVSWADLKNNLSKFLNKKDLITVEDMMKERIQELPMPGIGADGQPLLSKWWAASVLAHLSEKTPDAAESMELKQAAGKFLETKT